MAVPFYFFGLSMIGPNRYRPRYRHLIGELQEVAWEVQASDKDFRGFVGTFK